MRLRIDVLVLVAALPLSGCLGFRGKAQVQLGGEDLPRPDPVVVLGHLCSGDDDAARLYLDHPAFAWLGEKRERWLVDAKNEKLRGACPCPAKGCPGGVK